VNVAAQEAGPDQLVQKVTEEVLASIKGDKQLAAGDKSKALKLAEEKVLPHIDFEHAVRLAVGRAWQQATPGWKIFDIVVEGVSLVLTYRSEFDAVVKQQGVDGLIKTLAQKNTPPSASVGSSGKK